MTFEDISKYREKCGFTRMISGQSFFAMNPMPKASVDVFGGPGAQADGPGIPERTPNLRAS
jgi:hypothetical protein